MTVNFTCWNLSLVFKMLYMFVFFWQICVAVAKKCFSLLKVGILNMIYEALATQNFHGLTSYPNDVQEQTGIEPVDRKLHFTRQLSRNKSQESSTVGTPQRTPQFIQVFRPLFGHLRGVGPHLNHDFQVSTCCFEFYKLLRFCWDFNPGLFL